MGNDGNKNGLGCGQVQLGPSHDYIVMADVVMAYGRYSWDPLTTLVAVRGAHAAGCEECSECAGHNTVNATSGDNRSRGCQRPSSAIGHRLSLAIVCHWPSSAISHRLWLSLPVVWQLLTAPFDGSWPTTADSYCHGCLLLTVVLRRNCMLGKEAVRRWAGGCAVQPATRRICC